MNITSLWCRVVLHGSYIILQVRLRNDIRCMYINLFPFNPSIPRSLSSNGNGQWAETVLTEARKDFDVIIKKVKLDLFLWGGVGGCVWVVWISISMPLYKSHFQEHWALSSTKLILHDRLQALLGSPSKWTIYHPSLLAQPRVSDQGKRKKKREKKKLPKTALNCKRIYLKWW